jgi:DNA repair exonuclease SbcCD ATPase subunit
MSELKLKRLKIRNWMRFKDAELEFPDSGLVLVVGSNKAARGKLASVGSGKTALGEAFCRTLLGTSGRFTHAKSYTPDKKGDFYVQIEAEHRGKRLIVENGYKCPELGGTGEALRYSYDGKKPVERSRMAETRDEIAQIIGVTPALADWTVFIDGRKIEFNKLSQENAVNLVMAALVQPPWTQFFERSRTLVNNFKQNLSNDETQHTSAINRLERAKKEISEAESDVESERHNYEQQRKINDERIERLRQEAETKKQATKEAVARQAAIRKRLEQAESEKAEAHHALEIERNTIDDEITAANEKKDAAVEKRSSARSLYESVQEKLDELNATPKNCPTCSKPWDKVHSAEEIKKITSKVTKAEGDYDKAKNVVEEIEKELRGLRIRRQETSTKISNLGAKAEANSLRDEFERIECANQSRDSRIHSIDLEIVHLQKAVSDSGIKSAEATLKERKSAVGKIEDEIKQHAASLAENKEVIKVVSYWNKAFGPTGIPNMVLTDALVPMNEVSKAISNRMTGGTIHVTYSTTKTLAKGDSKAELVINVDNEIGSREIDGSSKGEGGLTNFIIAETLSEVGNVSNRIGFRWYDEIVPNQDPVVAKSIYAYMRETAHRLGILVFLVDHNPAAENYADHILQVTKTAEDTKVDWLR